MKFRKSPETIARNLKKLPEDHSFGCCFEGVEHSAPQGSSCFVIFAVQAELVKNHHRGFSCWQ